ncbi:uncharacterized protein VTP21DRAFT_5536 [Calcarisporiella thermophila]|uniref:uncharacterized protein n=1 Tax=Calcarisporiella thermophila TaxID=911321 RepID=UPI003743CCBE
MTFAVPAPKKKAPEGPASLPNAERDRITSLVHDSRSDLSESDSKSQQNPPIVAENSFEQESIAVQHKVPAIPPLDYVKPDWSAQPISHYSFEILKGGIVIEELDLLSKEFLIVGRLPICDIPMEHPSVSRYHAIIQFSKEGKVFLYDLQSSHGTYINKRPVQPRNYIRLRVGDQLRFGESTRLYILQSPEAEAAEVAEREEMLARARMEAPVRESDGVTWGMQEDAVEEPDFGELPEDMKVDENAYYHKDPKKALKHWLENRGYDLEFEYEEEKQGVSRTYTARIQLPTEDHYGPIIATGQSDKKRDAERAAALDACIKLDSRGLLRNTVSESAKNRMKRLMDDEDEDEENDSFYDRTEKAEKARAKKAENKTSTVETFETLTEKREELTQKMEELKARIKAIEEEEETVPSYKEDDLDSYFQHLDKEKTRASKFSLQRELQGLTKEAKRLDKLIEIAKPVNMPAMGSISEATSVKDSGNKHVATKVGDEKQPISKALTSSTSKSPAPALQATENKLKEEQLPRETKLMVEEKHGPAPAPNLAPPSSSPSEPISTNKKRPAAKPSQSQYPQPPQESTEPAPKKRVKLSLEEYEERERQEREELSKLPQSVLDEEVVDATWEPPKGQKGDGKTALNDKYGY